MITGIAAIFWSCFADHLVAAAALAIFGCTCLWSIID
jgi:hypothetical protein